MILTVLAYAVFAAGYVFACFAWFFSRKFEDKPRSVFSRLCRIGRGVTAVCGVLSVLWFGSSMMTIITLVQSGEIGEVFYYTLVCAVIFAVLEVVSWLAYRRYNKAITETVVVPQSLEKTGKKKGNKKKK